MIREEQKQKQYLHRADSPLRLSQQKCCRICFDREIEGSKLIAPCKCRGSSRYIHIHCLQQWQETAIENNAPHKAIACPVCLSDYTYPSKLYILYRRIVHHSKTLWAVGSILFFTLLVTPVKLLLHVLLVIVTIPFGQISLGNMALAWVGCDFPPQLALIRDGRGLSIPSLRRGMLLVASRKLPNTSYFYRSVILILEHSKTAGSRGVIINLDRDDTSASSITDLCIGNGGPMESDVFSVIHDCLESKQFSKTVSSDEHIYVAENEHAFQTIQYMLRMKSFGCQRDENDAFLSGNSMSVNNQRVDASEESLADFSRSYSDLGINDEIDQSNDDSRWETESLDTIMSTASSAVEGRSHYIRAFTSLLTRFSQRLRTSLENSGRQLSQHTSTVLTQATRRLDALRPTSFQFRSGAFPLALIPENHELFSETPVDQLLGLDGRSLREERGLMRNNRDSTHSEPARRDASNVTSILFSSIADNVSSASPFSTMRNPNYRSISLEERERDQGTTTTSRRRNAAMDMLQSIQCVERSSTPHRGGLNSIPFSPERTQHNCDEKYIEESESNRVNVRFFRGNCLWLPGQLAGEVWARDWHLLSPRHEQIFLVTDEQKHDIWSKLIDEAESFSDSVVPSAPTQRPPEVSTHSFSTLASESSIFGQEQ
jgi:putative AlgH/UPF0301 family transcriptional regulator